MSAPQRGCSVGYMALFPSVVGYLIYYYALRASPASRVSAFSYLQPLLATVMAAFLLGEHAAARLARRRSAGAGAASYLRSAR